MQTVYVVEGYDKDDGRYCNVFSNRETAIQMFNDVWYEFGASAKETESFSIEEIDKGFIRFATLSDNEYIGVCIKTIDDTPPMK